jgi:hypothetical protein
MAKQANSTGLWTHASGRLTCPLHLAVVHSKVLLRSSNIIYALVLMSNEPDLCPHESSHESSHERGNDAEAE